MCESGSRCLTQIAPYIEINGSYGTTIEEGSIGGFGSYVNNYLLQNDMFGNNHLIIRNLFIPDLFTEQATQDEQYEECGLNAKQIFSTISEILEMKSKPLSKEKITEQAC